MSNYSGVFGYILFLLGMIAVLTSCSIQKRRYRPGFHISINKNYSKGITSRLIKPKLVEPTELKSTELDLVTTEAIDETAGMFKDRISPVDQKDAIQPAAIKVLTQEMAHQRLKQQYDKAVVPELKDVAPDHQIRLSEININHQDMNTNQNTKPKQKLSQRHIAIIIGASLLLMALIAGFSATTINNLFLLGNPAQTALNLSANWSGFIGAIIGWIGIFILDVLVSIGVLKYYQKEKARLAIFTGVSRALYTLVLGGAITQLLLVNLSLSSTQIYHLLQAFNQIWGWGLILFGVHLIMLGILYHNEGGKKWFNILIKVLLISAGIGYLLQYIGILLVANPIAFAATVESIFLVSMILGEVLFAFWILFKGGKS